MKPFWKVLTVKDRYWVTALALVLLLSLAGLAKQFYFLGTFSTPATGGVFREGMLGRVSNLNPLFAQGNSVDQDLSRLIFAGLTKYDPETKQVVGDLAEFWELSDDHLSYTFKLRPDLKWHDGEALTSEDIVFTYQLITNPAFEGRLRALFADLKVEKLDNLSVKFTLKKENAFFPGLLNIGLLPEHLLKSANPAEIRSLSFNQHPIGAGPFRFVSLSSTTRFDRVELAAFRDYYSTTPYIPHLVILAYENQKDLLAAHNSLDGLRDLQSSDLEDLEDDFNIRSLKLPRYEAAILNLASPLLNDKNLRSALSLSLDKDQLLTNLPEKGDRVEAPIPYLEGFDPQYDPEAAKKALETGGYKKAEEQSYYQDKEGKVLELELVTLNAPNQIALASALQKAWDNFGIKINITSADAGTLNTDYLAKRAYDILLLGQNLGSDIDLYSFWHSSQSTNGQNFSQLKSIDVDLLIEKIRKTPDYDKQLELTRQLCEKILSQVPAIFLYTPYYYYAISKDVQKPFIPENLTVPADRYTMISNWYLAETRIWK